MQMVWFTEYDDDIKAVVNNREVIAYKYKEGVDTNITPQYIKAGANVYYKIVDGCITNQIVSKRVAKGGIEVNGKEE